MELAIQAHNIRKTYPPAVTALDGVDLEVQAGTIHAVLGPNGAGKSTLTRVLCTLAVPDSGEATVAGVDVLAAPARARRSIGVVGQQHGASPEATVRENLRLQAEFQGISGGRARAAVKRSLARFELEEIAGRIVRTCSGGQRRRVDLALGLLHEPRVLFLDEPTTGLDPETRAGLWQQIRHLCKDAGATVLLTTHYMDEADQLAERVTIVDHGQVVVDGAPERLKRELGGDTLMLDVSTLTAGVGAALAVVDGVDDVQLDGRRIRARARDGAAALPLVLPAIERAGAVVTAAQIAQPTLDDVYLKYTGHAYEDDPATTEAS